jgi:2-keto-4-pentenoate hydratase/2-oxohepta-3-ene-1,7-dioic acid hydratase in catechol pathway
MTLTAARFMNDAGEVRLGSVRGDQIVDAGPAGPQGFVPSSAGWAAIEAADGPIVDRTDVRLLAPVVPSKVLCIGLNYLEHAREAGLDVPPAPLVFAKVPSAIIGPDDTIVVPPHEPQPDFEAEVALVIGRRTKNVSVEEALDAIGGITAFNDVSGRAAQFGDGQWTRGKGYDTFAPIGPVIAQSAGLDLGAVGVRCTLSGEMMQESSTADLIFSAAELVAYLSDQFTLEPGDVIATGTPAGVGVARSPQRFLQDGDIVEVWVEGVGILRNPVRR